MNELEKLAREFEEKFFRIKLGEAYPARKEFTGTHEKLEQWLFGTFAVRLLESISFKYGSMFKVSSIETANREILHALLERIENAQYQCQRIAEEGK